MVWESHMLSVCPYTLILKERSPYHLWFRKVFKSMKRTEEADKVHLLSVAYPTDMDQQVLETKISSPEGSLHPKASLCVQMILMSLIQDVISH